jgi:hypothetical protein
MMNDPSKLNVIRKVVSLVRVRSTLFLNCRVKTTRRCDRFFVVCYESIKRELKRRLVYGYRCDERLKTQNEESTRLVDTGLVVELEHLKTKTRLIDEKSASVRGECET